MLGEFLNVDLTDEEQYKLRSRFGDPVTDDYIERLSCWLKNTRKRRSSHYACILTWIRKDRTIVARSAGHGTIVGLKPGEDHEHRCPACHEKPHEWHCGGKDGDGWPCQMTQTVACPEYMAKLEARRRQRSLGL